MASQAREIVNHRYYRETEGGLKQKLEEILLTEKRKNPSRIPYFFSASQVYAGKFMLGYMPRNKPRVEYVTVCPEGFRYRGRVHATVNGLLRWFKEHFRDPIPGINHFSNNCRDFVLCNVQTFCMLLKSIPQSLNMLLGANIL